MRAVLLLALATTPALAGGFGIPEIGVRRTGMATVVGRPDDPSAIHHNPGGLVLQHGWTVYVSMGLSLLDSEFSLQAWDQSDRFLGVMPDADGYYKPVRPTRAMGVIPMIAVTGELIPDRLVVAASVYVGNATGAQFQDDAVTRYHLQDGYIVAPEAVVAAAYRVLPSLAVGATVGVMDMRVHRKSEVFPIFNGMDVSSITGTHPELELDGSAWTPTWTLGAFGQPHPRVSWGAAVTGRVDANLHGPVQVTFSDDAGSPGDTLVGTQTTSQLLPWAFSAGGAVDATAHLELAGDVRYWLYRQYESQHTDVSGIALLRELDTEKDYHDSWQVSAGARVHDLAAAAGLELLAGAAYDHTPAPTKTVTLDQPSFSHPSLHLGARWRTGRYRFGASYIHYWYLVPTITDSITGPPSNIRGSGNNNIFTVSVEAKL